MTNFLLYDDQDGDNNDFSILLKDKIMNFTRLLVVQK